MYGERFYPAGPNTLEGEHDEVIPINIISCEYTWLSALTEIDAHRDGFGSLFELMQTLREIYPQAQPNDIVTIVHFELRGI
jgi:hypothetical protein